MAICNNCGRKYSKLATPVSTKGVCGECFEAELAAEAEGGSSAAQLERADASVRRMTTQRSSRSSWRIVVAVVLLAFGATALHRADRNPLENYTQAALADVIALALIVSHFRRKHRAERIGVASNPPSDREATLAGVARSSDQHDEEQAPKSPRAAASATPLPAGGSSLENELRSLAALKPDGIISEEEFTAKKRALLGL
jgi:hypothetical protein